MAIDWSIESAVVDNEGTQIVLEVTASGPEEDFPDGQPDPDDSDFGTNGISSLNAYRFDATTLAVAVTGNTATQKRSVFEMDRTDDAGTTTITFKVALDLQPSRAIAAYANPASNAASITIAANAITLACEVGNPVTGPTSADTLDLDVSKVGRMPDAATLPLALHCDVQAEYVQRGGTTGSMSVWTNIDNPSSGPTQGTSARQPQLVATTDVPAITYGPGSGGGDWRHFDWSSPVAITTDGTYAVAIKPSSADNDNLHHVVGRFDQASGSSRSWRVGWDGDNEPGNRNEMLFITRGSSTTSNYDIDVGDDETNILMVLRRQTMEDGTTIISNTWINGRIPTATGALGASVDTGAGPVTIGARRDNTGALVEGFNHQINQIVLYPTFVGDLGLALVVHQMALHAGVDLGTPVTHTTQPFSGPGTAVGERPIAVLNLSSGGQHNGRYWGQNNGWRNGTQAEIEAFLKGAIGPMLNACDDFEVMFNRPGGTFKEDIVPTYIFGSASGEGDQVQGKQWDAMRAVWDHFRLAQDNTDGKRRAWFYTGGGLPLNDDGSLNTEGRMNNRVVAPISPESYVSTILSLWPVQDNDEDPDLGRYRCFFLDAATHFYGLFVELCHSELVSGGNYYLVSESITTDTAARKAAPFYGNLEFGQAPWWNIDDATMLPDKREGYNTQWRVAEGEIIYFGVFRGLFPYLYSRDGDAAGGENNMSLGNIYRFIQKGAVPVAWQDVGVYRKVGAAWDYAKQRIPNSRVSPSPRILRMSLV